jgi:hypothetical protein
MASKSGIEQVAQLLERGGIGQIALVVLDDVRDLVQVVALLGEVHAQVLDRLHVGFHALDLAVADEDHPVDTLEDELARGVVEDLARDGVEVEAGLESADLAEAQRQEVEEEGPLGLGGERDHLPLRVLIGIRIDILQIRRLPAQTGPVIDDFAIDLARTVIDE